MAGDRSSPTETRSPCLQGVLACRLLNALVRFLQASREMLKQQQQLSAFALKCAEETLQLARCTTSGCNSGYLAATIADGPSHSGLASGDLEAVDLPNSRRLVLLLLRWFAASMRATSGDAVLHDKRVALRWRDVADAAREAARLQAFCVEDAHVQAAAPSAAAAAAVGGDGSNGCGTASAIDSDQVSNAQLYSGAQEVLLAAAALCTPRVASVPPADLAAILWAAVTAVSSPLAPQKGQEHQQLSRGQQQHHLQQQLSPLFHAASATLLLPQQNAQRLLGMREERQEQQQKEQHRPRQQEHHPIDSLQLQSSWQLQQAAPLDKSLLTWSLLTWGRLASESVSAAANCSSAASAATSPLGAVEWLVLAASFQKQLQLQQKLLQSSGAMALHALAVKADELTRPGVVYAAAAACPSSMHASATNANKQQDQTGPSCTLKANEAATAQGDEARSSASLIALAALPLVRRECAQLLRNIQKATAADSFKTISCIRLLSSLLHSAALLRRIELQADACAYGNSSSRLPDKAVRRDVTTLIVQLLRQLYVALQQQRLQQQNVQSLCQIVWVMAETGVTHALLLEHLQLQAVAHRSAGQQQQQLQQQQQPHLQRQHMRHGLIRSFLHELMLRVPQQQHSCQQHQLSPFHLACCLRVSAAVALRSAAAALHSGDLMSVGERKEEAILAIHAQTVTERVLRMANFLPLLEKQQEQQQQQEQAKQQEFQQMQDRQHSIQHTSFNGLPQLYQAALTVAALRRWKPLLEALIHHAGECNKPPAVAAKAAAGAAAADHVALPSRVWDAARTAFAKASSYTSESQVQEQGVSFEAETHTAEGLAIDFRILSLPEQQQDQESQLQQQEQRIQELKGQPQQQRELRLILEVDGPSHFVTECTDPIAALVLGLGEFASLAYVMCIHSSGVGDGKFRLLPRGSTLLKNDLLTIFGWRVLRLHADAASAAAAQRELLLLLTQKAGTSLADSRNNRSSSVRSSNTSVLTRRASDVDLSSSKSATRWQRMNRSFAFHPSDFPQSS
ncbi:hypothetical protein Emed_003130 [Eimeria media]